MAITINHQTNDISATSGSLTIDGAAVGGGGGAWNLISTATVTSSVSSVEFTGVSGYTQYFLMLDLSTNYSDVFMRLGIDGVYDAANNYRNLTSSTGISQFNINTAGKYGVYGCVQITDLDRSSTANFRRTSFSQRLNAFASTANNLVANYGGYWGQQGNNSIQLLGSFVSGSASLYGVTK